MCHFKNLHKNHKLLNINNEKELKKENLTIEESTKDYYENKNRIEELKNKIEKEIIEIDKLYDKIDKEIAKVYELKH